MPLEKRNFLNKMHANNATSVFILMLLIVPISQLTLEQYLPSLPAMKIAWNSTTTVMQLTVSLYLLGLGISQLIYGPLSDYYGRKKILIFGLIIYIVASIATALTTSLNIFLIARFLQGLGIGAGSVLPKAMARDIYEDSALTRSLSAITIVWTITTILAPLIGGYIQQYLGWRVNFYIFLGYSFILLLILCKYLPETNLRIKKEFKFHYIIRSYHLIIKNKIFLGYTLCLALSFSILIAFSISAPFILQTQLNIIPKNYGKIMMLIGISYILGNISSNYFSKKYNNVLIIFIGTIIILLFSLIFTLISYIVKMNILSFMVPMWLIVFGVGLMYSNCMAITLNLYPTDAGIASAILGSFLMLSSFIISIIIAHSSMMNPMPLAIIVLFIAFMISLIQIILKNENIK